MSQPFSRRALIGTAAVVPLAGLAATPAASAATTAPFTLNATVLDGGEQVTSVTIHAGSSGQFNPASVTTGTFSVHAKATSPIPIAPGDLIFSEYDTDRRVTAARVDNKGNITLDLETAEGGTGGGTLGYILSKGRNVELDLVYTITQNAPLVLRNGTPVAFDAFEQGRLSSPEVDAFSYGVSSGGMNYRLWSPSNNGHGRAGQHPLVVWLHGGGEGGLPGRYTNEAQLRANRGALGFTTEEAQKAFGGAFVVAPQSVSAWMADGDRFAPQIKALVDELVAANPRIDPTRIHVLGCSNGGYMSLKMAVEYPTTYASIVPICCGATPNFFTDDELRSVSSTPSWFVHSKDDTTLPWQRNTGRAASLIDGEIVTLYDHVIWNGHQFPGHWSWIYVARNDPQHNGQHIWSWMADQVR